MPRSYETGMKVNYDPDTGRVIVAFRGRIVVLPEQFDSECAGVAEGENYCRRNGWSPGEHDRSSRRLRSAW